MDELAKNDDTRAAMTKKPHPHSIQAIAERLVLLRESMNMAQGEFATRTGIHRPTLNMYEAARRRPSLNDATKLKLKLSIPTDWLYFGEELAMPDRLLTPLRRAEALRDQQPPSAQSS